MEETNLEPPNLPLKVIFQLTKPRRITGMQGPYLALENLLLQDLSNPDTASRRLITIAGPNALAGSADLATAQLSLLQAIDNGVKIETDVGAIRDEDPLASVLETLFFERGELLEEAGDVDDGAGADEVDAGRGNQARGEDVEVVGGRVMDNCVAGICH